MFYKQTVYILTFFCAAAVVNTKKGRSKSNARAFAGKTVFFFFFRVALSFAVEMTTGILICS